MEVIEFLTHTDRRNLKYTIGMQVKKCVAKAEEDLNKKRQRLSRILDFEHVQYDEELALLCKMRAEENSQKRIDWVNSMRLESELAEKELLRLKQIQRERENCEALRHVQSRELLLETKKAQIYQIEEKKSRKYREKQIEEMWERAMESLMKEKDKQNYFEKKLQTVIAARNQEINLNKDRDLKAIEKQTNDAFKRENAEENTRAVNIEKAYRERERLDAIYKKSQQGDALMDQIKRNEENLKMQKSMTNDIDKIFLDLENQKMANELEEIAKAKVENRVYHACYLAHALEEKQNIRNHEKALDDMLIGTGCVLQQRNKKPYGKDKR